MEHRPLGAQKLAFKFHSCGKIGKADFTIPHLPPLLSPIFYFFVKQWIYLPTDFLINIPLKITRTYFALFQFKVDAEVLLTNNTQEPPSPALSSSINGVIY